MKKDLKKSDFFVLENIDSKRDVFISYKRENAPFVMRLYKELKDNDITVWVDLSHLYKEIGEDYRKIIQKAIDSSEYFLLIYTEHEGCSIEGSDFIINKELAYAVSKGKKILFYPQDPIDLNTSKIKPYIDKIQWLDTKETVRYQLDTQETISDEMHLAKISKQINKITGFSVFEDQNIFLIRVALQRILGKITVFGNYTKLSGSGNDEFFDNENLKLNVQNKSLFFNVPEEYKKNLSELGFFREDTIKEVERHIATIQPDKTELRNKLYEFILSYYNLMVIHDQLHRYISEEKYKGIIFPDKNQFDVTAFVDVIKKMVACDFIDDLKHDKTMFNGAELGVYKIIDDRTVNSEHPYCEIELYYSDYFTFKCMTVMFHVLCSIDDTHLKIENVADIPPLAPFLCSLGLGGFLAAYTEAGISLMWTKRSSNISSGDMWHFSYDETVSLLLDAAKENGKIIVDDNKVVHIDINRLLLRALKEEVGATEELLNSENLGIFEVGIIKSERLEIELISHTVMHLSDEQSIERKIKQMHDAANDGYLEISKIEFLPLREPRRLIGRLLTPEAFGIFERMQTRLRECVGKKISIGSNTLIESGSYVGDHAKIGDYCRIHKNVYIDKNVKIGNFVKIQNNNSIYEGVTLEDGVFIGTNVSFINDRYPRAILRSGIQVRKGDWKLETTRVCYGASIGAGAVIMCGVTIGRWAMVAAGSVVLEDVPEGAMVAGNPARVVKECITY